MKSLSLITITFLITALTLTPANASPRARDLGIPFEGTPGPLNAITDINGVEVGYSTLISGDYKHTQTPTIRTGITAIFPRGRKSTDPVFAAWFPLNGNGEMTGTAWIEESGFLESPIMITNTHSVGIVRDAVIKWQAQHGQLKERFSLPVVAETYDGYLNDINGQHIKEQHVFQALDSAKQGPVAEGNVGGGTGMISFEFKGGTGTASRHLLPHDGGYTVGVLVQSNFGARYQAVVAGTPVGKEMAEHAFLTQKNATEKSSIIVVVATDAPLTATQLKRLAKRAALGIARTGGNAMNSSGDIIIAFSTANPGIANSEKNVSTIQMLSNEAMNPLFSATAYATEEAIVNALVAAKTMTGIHGVTIHALPHDQLQQVLRKYNRLLNKIHFTL